MIRRLSAAVAAAALLVSIAATAVAAGGPPRNGLFVDRAQLPPHGPPTHLRPARAPARAVDRIYVLGDGLLNVAEAKPGDRDYNGGRWMVLPVTWAAGAAPVQLTSAEQVEAYAAAGMLTIASAPVKLFECPVIPVPGH